MQYFSICYNVSFAISIEYVFCAQYTCFTLPWFTEFIGYVVWICCCVFYLLMCFAHVGHYVNEININAQKKKRSNDQLWKWGVKKFSEVKKNLKRSMNLGIWNMVLYFLAYLLWRLESPHSFIGWSTSEKFLNNLFDIILS